MSRVRQVPALDEKQREKALQQIPDTKKIRMRRHPFYGKRQGKMSSNQLHKLRWADTPQVISTGCSNLRSLVNNIQNITSDFNNLLGSIENLVPLVSTYLTAIEMKENLSSNHANNHFITRETISPAMQTNQITSSEENIMKSRIQPESTVIPSMKQPRTEDIQQLLENPFVKNMLTNFLQNNSNKV